jgi:hypothetical protein
MLPARRERQPSGEFPMKSPITISRVLPQPSWLSRHAGLLLGAALGAVIVLGLLASTGFGVTTTSPIVTADVPLTLSLADPTAIDAAPAPVNGPIFTGGSPDTLNLGDLTGSEDATASLTWLTSTNNPNGYSLTIENTGAAPLLQPSVGGFADMDTTLRPLSDYADCTGPIAAASVSSFGVSAGDAVGHSQASVNYAGTPWGTTGGGGTQGTLYRNIPVGGALVGQVNTPAKDSPTTLNFAALIRACDPVSQGAYAGTARVTALTL